MTVDAKDYRKNKAAKFTLDTAALQKALAAAGVLPGAFIKLRLVDGDGKKQGQAQRIGPNAFRVIVRVLPKASYGDAQMYVLNNSLVHELRHVAQMQANPGFTLAYSKASKSVGYHNNPFEVEARYFGRIADHTGTKRPDALGKSVWAIRF
jgi:hypothetical protein